jgi:hypothetical protein
VVSGAAADLLVGAARTEAVVTHPVGEVVLTDGRVVARDGKLVYGGSTHRGPARLLRLGFRSTAIRVKLAAPARFRQPVRYQIGVEHDTIGVGGPRDLP